MKQFKPLRPGDVEEYSVDVVGDGWLKEGDEIETDESLFSLNEDETGIEIVQQNWDEDGAINTVSIEAVEARKADYEVFIRLKTTSGRDRTYVLNIPVHDNAG